jgi:hypothetical protein
VAAVSIIGSNNVAWLRDFPLLQALEIRNSAKATVRYLESVYLDKDSVKHSLVPNQKVMAIACEARRLGFFAFSRLLCWFLCRGMRIPGATEKYKACQHQAWQQRNFSVPVHIQTPVVSLLQNTLFFEKKPKKNEIFEKRLKFAKNADLYY